MQKNILKQLMQIDLHDLNFKNVGIWPKYIKFLMTVLLVMFIGVSGYQLYIEHLLTERQALRKSEIKLKQQYSLKASRASNLSGYKSQVAAIKESLDSLLRQLPDDTEVPDLLDDITRAGVKSGLTFEEIKLLPEQIKPFYIELPIKIDVVGAYHDFAVFLDSIADMSRIVTVHDFSVVPADIGDSSALRMHILAKTYRYNKD